LGRDLPDIRRVEFRLIVPVLAFAARALGQRLAGGIEVEITLNVANETDLGRESFVVVDISRACG